MIKKFDTTLQKYFSILTEQPEPTAPPMDTGAGVAPAAPAGAPPTMPPTTPDGGAPATPEQPQQPASVAYAILAQVLLDAFKTKIIRNKSDIKYSDNAARSPQQAYQYLEMIKRNLQPDLQKKTTRDFGKGGKEEDLDSADLISLTNLALKALFYVPKDTTSTEFNNVFKVNNEPVVNVTPENAKIIVNNVRRFVSQQ